MNRPDSIVEIGRRAAAGTQSFDGALREFLDAWQSMDRATKAAAIAEEPCPLGRIESAYLAALAEHLAVAQGLPAPAWSEQPLRFLSVPFFAGGLESLKATLIVESPLAFRRRLIFISADALSRPPRTNVESSIASD